MMVGVGVMVKSYLLMRQRCAKFRACLFTHGRATLSYTDLAHSLGGLIDRVQDELTLNTTKFCHFDLNWMHTTLRLGAKLVCRVS
jgi:hypothetical protein